jgi:thiamine kinase-like enzyme
MSSQPPGVTSPPATAAPADLAALFDQVPSLQGRPRSVTELPGGLTNRNFKITTHNGTFMARVASEGGELLAIDREHEYRNSVRAAAAGVGAPVVEYARHAGVLVLGFLDGRTLTNADVADQATLVRIAGSCRRLHAGERFDGDFDMFQIQRGYLAVARERGIKIPAGYDDWMPAFEAAARALAIRAEPTVPCNNDLLAANFIDVGDRIALIDYEYSGNNEACFELGNIWGECQLSDEALAYLVTQYYGRPLRNKIARARLLGLAGKYGWTLWGAIQAAVSPIDFDFWSWAMHRFDGATQGFSGAEFDRACEEVQRDD